MAKQNNKVTEVPVSSIIRKLFVKVDGNTIEVKQIDNPTDYGVDVILYTKEAVKGKTAGTKLFCVDVKDYVKKTRESVASIKAAMLADFMSGMTPEQVQVKYNLPEVQ